MGCGRSELGPIHNVTELIQSPNDSIGLAFNGRPGTLGSRELVASKGQRVFYPFLVQLPYGGPHGNPAGISVQNERLSNPRNAQHMSRTQLTTQQLVSLLMTFLPG